MIKRLLCLIGSHDIEILDKDPISGDLVEEIKEIVNRSYRLERRKEKWRVARDEYRCIMNDSVKREVCIRDGCNYIYDHALCVESKLLKLKKKMLKLEEDERILDEDYERLKKERAAKERRRRSLASAKLNGHKQIDGALSVPESDGSLSIAEDGRLSIDDKEL